MRYLIIIEHGEGNLSAYVPDLPGCMAVGDTREEVLANMRGAISMHLDGMREDREAIPTPNSDPEWVDVDVPSPATFPSE